jgi:uncharacterized repeat protein (TIGR03803 family)
MARKSAASRMITFVLCPLLFPASLHASTLFKHRIHAARLFLGVIVLYASSLTPSAAQQLNTLFKFTDAFGTNPVASLVQGTDGNLYGTTLNGGANEGGTVFQITPAGQLTTIYSFCAPPECSDGGGPEAPLTQGSDGDFYGTTVGGRSAMSQWGTVFKISSTGSLTTLHRFQFTDGALPRGTLSQTADGSIYGTTYQGGSSTACFDGPQSGCGTIYKIAPDGTFSTLYNFCSLTACADGANPVGGLILGGDGNLYGTTYVGGSAPANCSGSACGTVFKVTPAGVLTTLYSFCSQSNCPDGQFPNAALVQGKDGNFYGTASQGGQGAVNAVGTVFKITPAGQLTTLYSFCSQTSCAEGDLPTAGLVLGKDGNFYGTTTELGAHGNGGTVFKISSSGRLTTLYSFCSPDTFPNCLDGETPYGGLIQASDGKFYGTTQGKTLAHCRVACGTVFSFGTGLTLTPASARVGTRVTIVGLNLTGATAVRFNGTAASFTFVSGTKITAIVPPGASSGRVTVTTPGGVLTSNSGFVVLPFISSFKPLKGPVGSTATILGTTLTKTKQVTFGGIPAATFTVNSDSQVTATVPGGAQTGHIAIVTSSGTATSAGTFTVTF